MGLPELSFAYRAAAQSAANRSKKGVVALILRDEGLDEGVYTVAHEADIPTELGAENKAYIKRALTGYVSTPSKVLAAVLNAEAPEEGQQAVPAAPVRGLELLTAMDYDYVAGPPDLSKTEAAALAAAVKARRAKSYIGKAVLPDTAADHECVVNFTGAGIVSGGRTYTGSEFCSRIAGMLAGTPAEGSATGAALPEVSAVEERTEKELDAAIEAGELVLYHDGRKVRLGRAVNSKTTIGQGESEAMKKIKVVETIDLIHYYAVTTADDEYRGQCANTYDNKMVLLAAMREFLRELEGENLLEEGSSGADIDLEATRQYLKDQGISTAELSEDELRRHSTGSFVFIELYGTVLDAMEDFRIGFTLRN